MEVVEAVEVIGTAGSKAWKITTEDFIVIQILEFSLIFIFWKRNFFGRIWKYHFTTCSLSKATTLK